MSKKGARNCNKTLVLPQGQPLLFSDPTNPLLKLFVFLLPSRSQNTLCSCHFYAG